MATYKKLGQSIKKARNNLKLTQVQVAEKANINANYYARIERGEENPTIDILEKIVKALKINSKDIMPF